jgi:hypothetical protein
MPTIHRTDRGEALPIVAFAVSALVLIAGATFDGGYGYAQRGQMQSAADFAAMAGTRIVGQKLTGRPIDAATAANVQGAIEHILAANDAELVTATFVDDTGRELTDVVTADAIPDEASGVVVEARSHWRPIFIGLISDDGWLTTTSATAFSDATGAVHLVP